MNNRASIVVNQGFKKTYLNASQDSSIGLKKGNPTFRQVIIKYVDIAVSLFLGIVLISAFMQPLFRDLLLDWLRKILETH